MKKRKNLPNNQDINDTYTYYMDLALKEAKKASAKDEVPVGAVLVSKDGKVLAKAHNTSEYGKNALEHAEMKVLAKASKLLKTTRLWDCSIYITLEPCPMCATAISMMRVKKIIFGAENKKGGAVLNGIKIYDNMPSLYKPEIISHIKEEEASHLLSNFFKSKRKS